MPELKPCPFCGSPAFSYTFNIPLPDQQSCGCVECASCEACIEAGTEEQAIEIWNRRVQNDET